MFRASIARTAAAALAVGTLGFAAPVAAADSIVAKPPIYGGGGADVLFGTSGADDIFGYASQDVIFGRAGSDRIDGGTSRDHILPGPGTDTVYGDPSDDFIYDDDAETDKLSGGDGDDNMHSANGVKDYVDCGAGTYDEVVADPKDVLSKCERVFRVNVDADDLENGYRYNYRLGTGGADYLFVGFTSGDERDDHLAGLQGNDVLNGSDGNDMLFGGDGEDHVEGGPGGDWIIDDDNDRDVIRGQDGADRIYAANGFADTIDCGESTHAEGQWDEQVEDLDEVYADGVDTVVNCEKLNPKWGW